MHDIEPYWNWRHKYAAEEDEYSPWHGEEHSEFEFHNAVYDHVIHPQWDTIGSATLYTKLIYADYDEGYAIMELIGEWNDLLYNDIMILKRDIVDLLIDERINKFILVGENVLNFHYSDDEYYNEWFDDVEEGWIVGLNFRNHVIDEMKNAQIDYYINLGGKFQDINWRTFSPNRLFELLDELVSKRLHA